AAHRCAAAKDVVLPASLLEPLDDVLGHLLLVRHDGEVRAARQPVSLPPGVSQRPAGDGEIERCAASGAFSGRRVLPLGGGFARGRLLARGCIFDSSTGSLGRQPVQLANSLVNAFRLAGGDEQRNRQQSNQPGPQPSLHPKSSLDLRHWVHGLSCTVYYSPSVLFCQCTSGPVAAKPTRWGNQKGGRWPLPPE